MVALARGKVRRSLGAIDEAMMNREASEVNVRICRNQGIVKMNFKKLKMFLFIYLIFYLFT